MKVCAVVLITKYIINNNIYLNIIFKGYDYSGDPNCELLLWWTDFEAVVTGDMERVRNMWNEILNAGHNQSSSYWIKYLNIEMYISFSIVYFIN